MDRRPRSAKYQEKFLEITGISDYLWLNFNNQDHLYHYLNPFYYNEDLLLLQDKLKLAFWKVANCILTQNQIQVIELLMIGLTQEEIAHILKRNQATINTTINGAYLYQSGKSTKKYGGVIKKMKAAIEKDKDIQALLQEISEYTNQRL